MADHTVEREYRFDVPENLKWKDVLRAIPESVTVGNPDEKLLSDTYWDTPSFDLLFAGFGCRVRDDGQSRRLELKFEEKPRDERLSVRREWLLAQTRTPVLHPAAGLKRFFMETFDAVLPAKPQAFLSLEVFRKTAVIQAGNDRLFLSLDLVSARALNTGGEPVRFAELELEYDGQSSGEPSHELESFLSALMGLGGVKPSAKNKLAKAVGRTGIPALKSLKPAFIAEQPAGAVAPSIMAYYLDKVRQNEFGTRLGIDSEYLHDMRVAVRKLRSALPFFGPMLYAADAVRLKAGLSRIADALGLVRDCDVFEEGLESHMPEAFRVKQPDSAAQVSQMVSELREERRERMLFELSRSRHREFTDWCADLLSAGPFIKYGEATCVETVGAFAARKINKLLRSLEKSGTKLLEKFDHAEDAAIHRLRIRFKKLRYAVEFFQPVLGEKTRALSSALPMIQDAFGAFVDTFFTLDFTDELIRRAGFGKSSRAVLDGLFEMKSSVLAGKTHLRLRLRETLSAYLQSDIHRAAVAELTAICA